jgi:hypothetical protein
MKRTLIAFAAIFISFLAILAWMPRKAAAQPVPQPQPCNAPKSWGAFRGGVGSGTLLFEDSSGTIRWVNLVSGTGTYCTVVERR